ncbi:hypothetical protein [Oceaniglobus trochenteri]|uniref:hypothetical protein n=1 Tax=Oceaniglobus trochenteri TaxID=2763260 RepID=UPI001CFFCDB1|nr:hypothetical protein [Oceaniglobus trochenteri]
MSNAGVKSTFLNTSALVDEIIGNRDGGTVRVALDSLGMQMVAAGPVSDAFGELRSQITSGVLTRATWAEFSALDGAADGAGGEVPDSDTGSHFAATGTGYDGSSVANAGRYSWNESWSRWMRIGDTGTSGLAQDIADEGVARAAAVADLTQDIAEEINRAQTSEAALTAADAAEATTRAAAVANLTQDIAEEINRAQTSEAALTAADAAEATTRAAAVSDLTQDIAEEINRAQTSEAALTAADAAEATTRAAAVSDLTQDIAEEINRATGSESALDARIDHIAISDVTRPGEAPDQYSSSLTGEPEDRPAIVAGALAVDDIAGKVWALPGSSVIAPRRAYAMTADAVYRLRVKIRMIADSTDPTGDAVQVVWQNLNKNKVAISQAVLKTWDNPKVVDGLLTLTALISRNEDGGGIDYATPATARYGVPALVTNGNTAITGVQSVEWLDVSDLLLGGADVAGLRDNLLSEVSDRISADTNLADSLGLLGGRVDDAETQTRLSRWAVASRTRQNSADGAAMRLDYRQRGVGAAAVMHVTWANISLLSGTGTVQPIADLPVTPLASGRAFLIDTTQTYSGGWAITEADLLSVGEGVVTGTKVLLLANDNGRPLGLLAGQLVATELQTAADMADRIPTGTIFDEGAETADLIHVETDAAGHALWSTDAYGNVTIRSRAMGVTSFLTEGDVTHAETDSVGSILWSADRNGYLDFLSRQTGLTGFLGEDGMAHVETDAAGQVLWSADAFGNVTIRSQAMGVATFLASGDDPIHCETDAGGNVITEVDTYGAQTSPATRLFPMPFVSGTNLCAGAAGEVVAPLRAGETVLSMAPFSRRSVRALVTRPGLYAQTQTSGAPGGGVLIPDDTRVLHIILIDGQSLSVGREGEDLVSTWSDWPDDMLMPAGDGTMDIRLGLPTTLAEVVALDPDDFTGFQALLARTGQGAGVAGQTIAGGLAPRMTKRARDIGAQHRTLWMVTGVGATDYDGLKQGTVDYENTLIAVTKAKALAEANGWSVVVDAMIIAHGEADSDNADYQSDLIEWQGDVETDIRAITGQVADVPFLLSMPSSHIGGTTHTRSIRAMLAAHEASDKHFVLAPNYTVPFDGDYLHLTGPGYFILGELIAPAVENILWGARDWSPVMITAAARTGTTVTLTYHVPVGPLVIDTALVAERNVRGFRYWDGAGEIAISAVTVTDTGMSGTGTVELTLGTIPSGTGEYLEYALAGQTGTRTAANIPRGNIRDSAGNTRKSRYDNRPLHNWAVHQSIEVTV